MSADLARSSGLGANFGTETVNLFNNQLLHSFDAIFLFKGEVEFLVRLFITELGKGTFDHLRLRRSAHRLGRAKLGDTGGSVPPRSSGALRDQSIAFGTEDRWRSG